MKQLFFNTDVYMTEKDFIMGGFHTDKTNISWNALQGEFKWRLRKAIEEWVEIESQRIDDREITQKVAYRNAIKNLSLEIYNYMGLKIATYDIDSLIEQVMNSDRYSNWEGKIKARYIDAIDHNKSVDGLVTEHYHKGEGVDKEEADELTNDVNFSNMLEVLNGIFNM